MLRSLFTGISGLSVHQTMLDVTGNNIANVNTTGFKSASTRFEDTFSQLIKSGSAGRAGTRGGVNPAQVGLGVKLQSITTNFTNGAAQTTGRNLDTMINGDGFFVLRKTNGTQVYTRNGSFGLDSFGQLVGADGSFVQGWKAEDDGSINATGNVGAITLPLTSSMEAKPTTKVTFGGNMPADQRLADTNKDETASNAFAATQKVTLYDQKGVAHDVILKFTRADVPATTPADGSKWKVEAFDAKLYSDSKLKDTVNNFVDDDGAAGAKLKLGSGATAEEKTAAGYTDGDDFTITFDREGKMSEASKALLSKIKIPIATYGEPQVDDNKTPTDTSDDKITVASAATADPATLDLSGLTGYAGVNNFAVATQDGNSAGTLTGFSIEGDGTVRGTFSNGDSRALARIATASFANPLGLEKAGGSYFVESGNSGAAQIGEPGSGTRGSITGGAIEMSNVDLAQEFTNLILSQRGFQANSRVITTSDEILQELVNMKR